MKDQPSLRQKILIYLDGVCKANILRFHSGWKEPLELYWIKCPAHGYVMNHPKGFAQRIECPYCWSERKQN